MSVDGIPYVGLHRHTSGSFLDGFGNADQVVDRLKSIGQTACGITDHGSVWSHIEFDHAFRDVGLKILFGNEMYHVPNREAYVQQRGRKASDIPVEEESGVCHLTILAQSQGGYQNLLDLHDLSYREGFYRKPVIDWEDVIRHQEGLVVLSGCVGGMLARCLYEPEERSTKRKTKTRKRLFNLEEGIETATAWAIWLKERIEQFYIEIVPCPGLGISEQSCVHLWKIAQELGIPTVLTDDAHFPRPEDHEAEDVMVCVQTRKKKHDHDRPLRLDKIHYHCTGDGVVERAQLVLPNVSRADLIAAAGRSVEIADRCNVELPRSTGPVFPVPIGLSAKELLEQWVGEGVEYRRSLGLLPDPDTAEWYEYCEREAYELEIIAHHSFENYFLLVADLVRWSEREDRWCVARGSCGGSLICWYLGITQIDPIKWDLPVERFIDKTRPDLPDIDLDFDARYRDEAFRYLEGKYGADRCAQIAALSTFRPRQAVKDVVKVFNNKDYGAERLTEAAGAALIDLLPELDNDGGIKARGLLAQLFRENAKAQDLLQKWPKLAVAAQIEGQIRQQTIHAAGFVVDSRPLTELVGVVTLTKGKVTQRVIACDKDLAARQGFLKIDALSVETMSAIAETLTTIGKDRHWLYALPLDDAGAYDVLARGKSAGLFQFKGHAASKILPQLAPSRFTDLIALAALARPGPIQSGGVREYTERKHGREQTPEFHPAVWEVLRETYGVILYQEQVMGIMRVAGFDWPDVHKIRKLVSKSGGTAALEAYRGAYREGMATRGVSTEEADHLWIQCQKAGDYVFNKAHGAAYALLAYWTAYLKCHYPDQFYSLFANHETKEEYRKQLLREYQELGGKIQLLDYNRSELKFSSPEPGVLLGGFATLHGIGASVGEKLIAGRPYRDWRHFLLQCPNAVGQVLAATGIHTGKLDLDVVLAIAPWFAEVEFLPLERAAFMRMKCHEIGSLLTRMEPKFGGADVRLLGRVTDCEVSPDKRGAGDRCRMTLTDPTGSVDIWFAAWKWGDVEEARDPLRGDAEGLGNTLYVTASLSDDGARLFGEDAILLRQSQAQLTLEARKTLKKRKRDDDATLLVD